MTWTVLIRSQYDFVFPGGLWFKTQNGPRFVPFLQIEEQDDFETGAHHPDQSISWRLETAEHHFRAIICGPITLGLK